MARQFQFDVQVGMVGINVRIPVPVSYYSFGGWKASLFGDQHMYGTEGINFFTRSKVVTSRWPDPATSSVDLGFPQKEIAESSYRYQRQLETGEKIMVGVNKFQLEHEPPLEILRVPLGVEELQVKRVRERKQGRPAETVRTRLAAVREAAKGTTNVMPPILEAVKAECTVGEIADIFREVFGVYRDPAWI